MQSSNILPQWRRTLLALRHFRDKSEVVRTQELCRVVQCNSSSLHRCINDLETRHGYSGHILRLGKCKFTGEMKYLLVSEPDAPLSNVKDSHYEADAKRNGNEKISNI